MDNYFSDTDNEEEQYISSEDEYDSDDGYDYAELNRIILSKPTMELNVVDKSKIDYRKDTKSKIKQTEEVSLKEFSDKIDKEEEEKQRLLEEQKKKEEENKPKRWMSKRLKEQLASDDKLKHKLNEKKKKKIELKRRFNPRLPIPTGKTFKKDYFKDDKKIKLNDSNFPELK